MAGNLYDELIIQRNIKSLRSATKSMLKHDNLCHPVAKTEFWKTIFDTTKCPTAYAAYGCDTKEERIALIQDLIEEVEIEDATFLFHRHLLKQTRSLLRRAMVHVLAEKGQCPKNYFWNGVSQTKICMSNRLLDYGFVSLSKVVEHFKGVMEEVDEEENGARMKFIQLCGEEAVVKGQKPVSPQSTRLQKQDSPAKAKQVTKCLSPEEEQEKSNIAALRGSRLQKQDSPAKAKRATKCLSPEEEQENSNIAALRGAVQVTLKAGPHHQSKFWHFVFAPKTCPWQTSAYGSQYRTLEDILVLIDDLVEEVYIEDVPYIQLRGSDNLTEMLAAKIQRNRAALRTAILLVVRPKKPVLKSRFWNIILATKLCKCKKTEDYGFMNVSDLANFFKDLIEEVYVHSFGKRAFIQLRGENNTLYMNNKCKKLFSLKRSVVTEAEP